MGVELKTLVFTDDAGFLRKPGFNPADIVISIDSQTTLELREAGFAVKDISEYIPEKFESWDDLYEHYENPLVDSSEHQGAHANEKACDNVFASQLVYQMTPASYIKDILKNILVAERPACLKFVIRDRVLFNLFSKIGGQLL